MSKKQAIHRHNYERLLSNIYESIKEKEFFLKRTPHIIPFTDDTPKSLPKLLNKDVFSKQHVIRDLLGSAHLCKEYLGKDTYQVEAKKTIHENKTKQISLQKKVFKTLEEEQQQISKENMKLLGLNIQKVNYSLKAKVEAEEGVQGEIGNGQGLLEATCQTVEDTRQIFNNRVHTRSRIRSTLNCKTPREKSAALPPKRSVNPEYQNPIYEGRIMNYRDFLFQVGYTYGVYRDMERFDESEGIMRIDQKYKAWIGLGNNGNLIKGLLKRRFWWSIQQQKHYSYNFIWTQLKNNQYFRKQKAGQTHNALPYRVEEPKTTQKNSIKTRRPKADKTNCEHLPKIMNDQEGDNYQNWSRTNRCKNYAEKSESLHLKMEGSELQHVHNHLTNNFYLGNKKAMFYNLKQYYELTGGSLFKSIPLTFHIKKGTKDVQYKRFVAYYRKRAACIKKQEREAEENGEQLHKLRNIWIVKPGELTNRGNGITVIDEVYELDAIMKSEGKHDNGASKTFIVQLYMDKPLLYKKRKFDIRHYMVITHLHGIMKAYWYNQGYIRTTSYEFDIHNFEREIHLTNDAVQKYTPLYGKYQPANKLSYAQFQRYLDANYPKQKYNFFEQIMPRMKEISLDAVKSAYLKISPEKLEHNFQIFGLDFMIDCDFKPWLIEINTNPCLELACPLLSRIIPQMVDQTFRLTLDVIYPPPCNYPNTYKHLVPEASLQNFKFQLFFDERIDGQHLKELYKRSKHNLLDEIGQISDDEVYEDEGKDIALDQLL